MQKSWLYLLWIAVCWLGIVEPARADEHRHQRNFASADEAANALVTAMRKQNEADWRNILGPEADRVIDDSGPHADQEQLQRFISLYDEKHTIEEKVPGRAELVVGPDDWPLPIPIIEGSSGRWTFDTNAGAQSIYDRRIGRNELSAIRTLLACVDAQGEYFDDAKRTTGTGVYAARLLSTPEHHDGLYRPTVQGEVEGPLGRLIAGSQKAGYPAEVFGDEPIPYEGYYFRVLRAQGPNANGGAKSYIESGRMTGGFGFIAWPAIFGSSGIMTFIVGPDAIVYQKDLGLDTLHVAAAVATFDPDFTWSRIQMTHQ
jgi:Protein of unknown function (DUF2950)